VVVVLVRDEHASESLVGGQALDMVFYVVAVDQKRGSVGGDNTRICTANIQVMELSHCISRWLGDGHFPDVVASIVLLD
jgi:hypothetical protein